MFDLTGKRAVVTGAASGIGAATATAFAAAGAQVALAWYAGDPHDVGDVLAGIEAAGGSAIAVETDVSDTSQVERLLATTVDSFGGVDVVVANAGIARSVPTAELSDDEWRALLEVDLLGVFRCFRAALPYVTAAEHGRLLATSSISGGVGGWPQHAHYTAAKAGVIGLVRTLALEVGRDGTTVNAVAPGVIATPQCLDPVNSMGPEGMREFEPRVPMGRNGEPEDVAAVFAFLASDEARYVTGQTIVVDGGATLAYI